MTLRWKLVGLYAVILTVVIAGFGKLMVSGVRDGLVKAVDAEIAARTQALGAVVELENGAWSIDPESGIEQEFGESSGLYYVMRDPAGAVVLSSPLAGSLGLPAGPPRAPGEHEIGGRHVRESSISVVKNDDTLPGSPASTLLIACGKDLAPTDFAVQSLVRVLAIVGPIVLVASLLAGLFLVSRALRPVDRIVQAAEAIDAARLSHRIEVRGKDEMARLGRTLNATFDRLEAAIARERQFTADASHELRTPLAVVTGNVELGLRKPRSAEEHREILADIGEAAARMQSVVEGLLVLARADSAATPLKREPVPLVPLCQEISRLHRSLAEKRHVTMDVAPASDVVVPGDPEQLRELVSNLVTNAIRYNRDGGRVTIRLDQMNGHARLMVEDTGVGIPPGDLPYVFERFYRVDRARSVDEGGVGLGLAIAKWIVDAHGGAISVESEPDRGTRFEVVLPACDRPATPDRAPESG